MKVAMKQQVVDTGVTAVAAGTAGSVILGVPLAEWALMIGIFVSVLGGIYQTIRFAHWWRNRNKK